MLKVLRGATLVAATMAMGMLAGLFYAFTVSVMPGLGRADGRTFVEAMQQINVAILNPWCGAQLRDAGKLVRHRRVPEVDDPEPTHAGSVDHSGDLVDDLLSTLDLADDTDLTSFGTSSRSSA